MYLIADARRQTRRSHIAPTHNGQRWWALAVQDYESRALPLSYGGGGRNLATGRSTRYPRSRLERSQVSPHPGQVRFIAAIRRLLPAPHADRVLHRAHDGHELLRRTGPVGILQLQTPPALRRAREFRRVPTGNPGARHGFDRLGGSPRRLPGQHREMQKIAL